MSEQAPQMTRRNFLKLTTQGLLGLAGLLGLSGLIRFLSFQPDPPPPKQFEIGLASDYPPDSRTTRPEIPALIIHSANGIQAISLVCTHLGCTVEVKSKSFACPCHGSQFDQAGKVTKGPASKPLETLKIEQTAEGNLIVSKD